MTHTHQLFEFAIIVARHAPKVKRIDYNIRGGSQFIKETPSAYTLASACKVLMRVSSEMTGLAERMCNIPAPPKGWEPKQRALEKRATDAAYAVGANPVISWDPRGACLCLKWGRKGSPSNTMGGDGYAVPNGRG